MKFTSLTKDADLEFYEPYRQASIADMILTVRTVTDPLRLAPALREAVLQTDPTHPISRITPWRNTFLMQWERLACQPFFWRRLEPRRSYLPPSESME